MEAACADQTVVDSENKIVRVLVGEQNAPGDSRAARFFVTRRERSIGI